MSSGQDQLPLVSVLMTAYNREKYIGAAIESVLSSAYTRFELIITDDQSTDQTVAIAATYAEKDSRIRLYVNEKNLGDYPNRNKSAALAKGKYLKYFDSDDILYKYTLNIMVEAMEANPDAAFAFASYPNQDNSAPFPIAYQPAEAYRLHFFEGGLFYAGPGGTIIRRDCFEQVGGFSGTRMVGDFELWLKLGRHFPILKINPNLIWWRVHEGQEFDVGTKTDMYVRLNHQVIMEALTHPSCPLHENDKKVAIQNSIRMQGRRILNLLLKGEWNRAIQLRKNSQISWSAVTTCWIPVNRIKKLLKRN